MSVLTRRRSADLAGLEGSQSGAMYRTRLGLLPAQALITLREVLEAAQQQPRTARAGAGRARWHPMTTATELEPSNEECVVLDGHADMRYAGLFDEDGYTHLLRSLRAALRPSSDG